ncbi:hypothetical protein RLV_0384 (plasmid) [Rhizobium leguminosarum bv. viciae]|nr:hypothetical protein RLV_0384 [Rhizobium leguminosarum bv. viciae]
MPATQAKKPTRRRLRRPSCQTLTKHDFDGSSFLELPPAERPPVLGRILIAISETDPSGITHVPVDNILVQHDPHRATSADNQLLVATRSDMLQLRRGPSHG